MIPAEIEDLYHFVKKRSEEKGSSDSPVLSAWEIISVLKANPDWLISFRLSPREKESRFGEEISSQRRARLVNPNILASESPFCTGNAADFFVIRKKRMEGRGLVDILGAAFLKPGKTVSADLIFVEGDIFVIADGASMVAKPEDSGFPDMIRRKCMIKKHFMPDVLWSTMLAVLLGKDNFRSPFIRLVVSVFKKSKKLKQEAGLIRQEHNPKKKIELINRAIGKFLEEYFSVEITDDQKIYLPSGVMAVVNLKTLEWATVGDVRLGYTVNKYGEVATVNRYEKVNDHDAAVKLEDYAVKKFLARIRTRVVGNIQGLPIEIEEGVFPLDKIKENGFQAVVSWTDGAEIPSVFRDYWRLIGSSQKPRISLSGTLLVRSPFVYPFFLFHVHKRYFKRLEADRKFAEGEKEGGKEETTPFLKWVKRNPELRADDASFIVAYFYSQ